MNLDRTVMAAALLAVLPPAFANDFPTVARAEYVINCMQESKATRQEMLYKCSCTIDQIAKQVKYDRWVDLSTIALGTSIAGERGGVIRDIKDGRKQIASYHELQAKAKKACFIDE